MRTITVKDVRVEGVAEARDVAVAAVSAEVDSPVVLSWHDRRTDAFAPDIPGGDPSDRWRDYGVSMGGTHEVDVDERFEFVIGDAAGFTEPKPRLVNMTDSRGCTYLCLEASCREDTRRPLGEVYPAGGGLGDG